MDGAKVGVRSTRKVTRPKTQFHTHTPPSRRAVVQSIGPRSIPDSSQVKRLQNNKHDKLDKHDKQFYTTQVLLNEQKIKERLYGRICSEETFEKKQTKKTTLNKQNCFYWSTFSKIVLIHFRQKENRLIDPPLVIFGLLSLSCWLASLLHSRLS